MDHLRLVLDRLIGAGLKLKPSKCHFVRREVQYLGLLITPCGLRPNPERGSAVKDFPVPQNIKEVRQFIGLASYYRRFISMFAKIAHPLHALTRKGAAFEWTADCQAALDTLKQKLAEATVLAYPTFDEDFILETDACCKGLSAVFSQRQEVGKLHPVVLCPILKETMESPTYKHSLLFGRSVTFMPTSMEMK